MKKLMTMMAALVTGLCVWADSGATLDDTFDASKASTSDWTTGWTANGFELTNEEKVTFDDENDVLKVTTGSDRLTRNVNDGSVYAIGDEGAFFDVHMDARGQALDEIPTLPDGARFALFFLDTTDMDVPDYVTKGVGLYAIAGDPSNVGGGNLLLYFKNASTLSATTEGGKSTRFTIKNYANVMSSGQTRCTGYMVYQDGVDNVALSPLEIAYAFPISDTTVTWSAIDMEKVYVAEKFQTAIRAKKESIALSMRSADSNVTALDFQGNVNLSKVVMSNDKTKFSFIGDDVAMGAITIGEGLTALIDEKEYAGKQTVSVSTDVTIYAKITDETKTLVKVTDADNALTATEDGIPDGYAYGWTYTYSSSTSPSVSISVVKPGVSVTIDGTTSSYESLADALSELSSADGTASVTLLDNATLTLAEDSGSLDLNGSDVTIDLNGKTLTGNSTSDDAMGVINIYGGSTTIKDTLGGGRIVSTYSDPATSAPRAIFVGSDATALVIQDSLYVDGAVEISEDWVASDKKSITLSGGSYLASANSTEGDTPAFTHAAYLAKGKAATKETIDNVEYWVVGEQTTVQYTVTFVTPDPTDTAADPTTSAVKVEENTTVTAETPTADGWTFLGWYETVDGKVSDEKFDFTTPITANITLTAKWSNWATVLGDADTDGAYKIDDETDLKAFAANVGVLPTDGVSFKLTGNITLTIPSDGSASIAGIGIPNAKDLLGTDTYSTFTAGAFKGTFDGGNFTISNVILPRTDYAGLFMSTYGATIKNLKVSLGNATGFATAETKTAAETAANGDYGGGVIVGVSVNTTVESCQTVVAGDYSTFKAPKALAGIVGYAGGATVIKDCVNNLAIESQNNKVAGITAILQAGKGPAAENYDGATIEGCTNNGNVSTTATSSWAAGLVSYVDMALTIKGTCAQTGTVTGDSASAILSVNGGSVTVAAGAAITTTQVGQLAANKAIDGLTFATVTEDTATFVKNDALELGGTYKVMASGAAYTMTALGSITFDTSLATVKVTQGGEYASEDDYSLTSATADSLVTWTLAKKATTPTLDPTQDPVEVGTKEDADALEITVTVPTEVASTVTVETYKGYFKKSVTELTDGDGNVTGYSVAAVLDEEVIVPDDVAAEIAGAFDTITGGSVAVTKAKPGLYYSVEQGQTLDNMTEGDRVMATSAKVSIPATKYEGSGFYRVRVSVTDKQ